MVGVELSDIACKAFFTENNLPFSILEKKPFTVYKGGNIEIWCGDILQFPIEANTNFTYIYDRAALFALPPEIRIPYVAFIKKLVKSSPHIDMLLITIEYDQSLIDGPPFVISDKMIQEFFSDTFTINKQQLPDGYISVFKSHPKFKEISVQEHVYWLTKM